MADEEEQEHGVETACYSGGPGEPYYQPTMTCLCGYQTGRCPSWQAAGQKMDKHLASVREKTLRKKPRCAKHISVAGIPGRRTLGEGQKW
jgi:hypothetical protein